MRYQLAIYIVCLVIKQKDMLSFPSQKRVVSFLALVNKNSDKNRLIVQVFRKYNKNKYFSLSFFSLEFHGVVFKYTTFKGRNCAAIDKFRKQNMNMDNSSSHDNRKLWCMNLLYKYVQHVFDFVSLTCHLLLFLGDFE